MSARTISFVAAALLLVARVYAEHYDVSAWSWRSIGPNRGGRSQAAAGSPKRPLEYYFGATGGGLWKTTNGGISWFPVTDHQIHSSSVGAVAVSESNPDVVYIGMGETELRGNIMQGDGVYKSSDAGKTWKHVGLADTQAISRIRIDPTDPDLVYVAAFGHPYGPNPQRGIFRSRDGGKTWERVLYRNDHSGAIDLCLDPGHPRTMFATIWDAYRTPWSLSSGGPGSGIFKSVDGGSTWAELTRNPGLPKGILGKITVAVSGAGSNRVFALVEADDGGLFQSNDGGATWILVSEDRSIRQRAFYFSRITADPKDRDTVYVMNVEFYRSSDGGRTLHLLRTPHADHHDLWIAPGDPFRMIESDDGGASVSTDGGKTWSPEQYPTGQFYHVSTTADLPYHVCGAQQDHGTACVPSDGGPNLRDPSAPLGNWLYAAGGGEAGYVAPDPKHPNVFYAGDQAGIITRYDRSTGETRAINVYPLFFSGMPASALKERWQWTFPIVFSPVSPALLFTASQHLWRTTTQGQRWEAISPDLTRHDPKTLGDSGGPITKDQNGPEIYGTIFSIAPSRYDANTIWTGSDDGLVFITRDGGRSWANVTPGGLDDFNRISMIEASPHDPAAAYIAAKRYQMDDRRPYVFKTHDYGKTWTRIVEGIAEADFAQAIREDPVRSGLLYLGTEHGIYASWNDGADWQPLSLNLPDTQVADVAVERNDLVIATHGRSFYLLNNIEVLRQLSKAMVSRGAHLFKPANVIRSLDQATISYYLSESMPDLAVEILDSKGEVIRRFLPRADADHPAGQSPASDSSPPALNSTAGIHRVIWDLRYPGPVIFPGIVLRYAEPGQGPVAPPGEYSVRLTVHGEKQVQSFLIERNPRLAGVSDSDLREQFLLAMQIRDQISRAHQMVIAIRSVKEQMEKRVAAANDPEITRLARDIRSKLDEVEQDVYQVRNRSPRDTLNFPIKLNNQLAVLQRLVDTGDARPTDQDYAVFRELSARVAAIQVRMDEVTSGDLPRLNRRLTAAGIEAVPAKQ